MIYALSAAAALLSIGLLAARRTFLITTVDGSSMEPALRSGDRLLIHRTKRARTGQVVVFEYPNLSGVQALAARRSRQFLIKRAVAVAGDRIPAGWGWPDVGKIAGLVVPGGSFVLLGDNRAASWDSRHYGFVPRDLLVGVVIRHLARNSPGSAGAPKR